MNANRLPPLPRLFIRRPNQVEANPCLAVMNSVLSMSVLSSLSLPFDRLLPNSRFLDHLSLIDISVHLFVHTHPTTGLCILAFISI